MVKCKKIIRRQTIPWLNVKRYQKTDKNMVKCKKIIRRQTKHWLNEKRK
jgi:hypothetical protein